MSKETLVHLNTNTLIGFTEKRGQAWHYREGLQGNEPNHYEGAIPVGDVTRRLFDWQAQECDLFTLNDGLITKVDGRKAIVRSDTNDTLGIFSDSYTVHQFQPWLLQNVANILGDELAISSAGLLKNGAVAWVEVSVPETIKTPEGIDFRPNLVAATSLDGSLATTYKRTVTLTVCDNTLAAALSETGQTYKVKHSKHSAVRLTDAQEALAIVVDTMDDFQTELSRLCAIDISDMQWDNIVKALIPSATDSETKRADNRRDELHNVYRTDARVKDWKGTAFGALQAVNTWQHHIVNVRGATSRADRNAMNALTGKTENLDRLVLEMIAG